MNKKTILMVILLILAVTPVYAAKINYTMSVSCASNSMYPTIDCHDTLVVNTVTRHDNLTVGSIYCYRPDYRDFYVPAYYYICHRLHHQLSNGDLVFKGDNNRDYDPIVSNRYVALEIVGW